MKSYEREHINFIMQYRKQLIKDLKINGCSICGYNTCDAALDFHHVTSEKNFKLNESNMYNKDSRIVHEFHICMLLCKNCHAEIHDLEKEVNNNES